MKLPNFSTINVIVIGDAMLDQYWEREVKRVSPEAPVPIFSINK
jgi:D-beta-D-heptose 7-phosphate kinase/D-beta-D-heptose 1-phosphate adenosyltransferase